MTWNRRIRNSRREGASKSSRMAELPPASSTPPLQSDAERQEMLDRMLTRLALADDSKLKILLSKILPYSISSLASPSPSVRKLVFLLSARLWHMWACFGGNYACAFCVSQRLMLFSWICRFFPLNFCGRRDILVMMHKVL